MPRYWANYGTSGFLGCFDAAAPDGTFVRGDRVLVDSPRGRETAVILGVVNEHCVPAGFRSCGTIQLKVTSPHAEGTHQDQAWPEAQLPDDQKLREQLISTVNAAAAEQPFIVPDVELLDGGATVVVHVLPWEEVDLSAWADELSERLQRTVLLLNVAELPRQPEASTCGDGGCGDGGCGGGGCGDSGCRQRGEGCGRGTCSRGSLKSADDLTDYFLSLRRQMEQRRTLA